MRIMSSDITLSEGVRQNLLSLQNTAASLTTTQEQLATGKKVNTAFDNPTSYFQSQSLDNRASDLSALRGGSIGLRPFRHCGYRHQHYACNAAGQLQQHARQYRPDRRRRILRRRQSAGGQHLAGAVQRDW